MRDELADTSPYMSRDSKGLDTKALAHYQYRAPGPTSAADGPTVEQQELVLWVSLESQMARAMLKILWQNIVDTFTRANYTLRLHREGNAIILTSLRNSKPWPIERMAAEDELLQACYRQFAAQEAGLSSPLKKRVFGTAV